MAERVSPTLRVLQEILGEIKATNNRLDQTNARLDQTNIRLERVEERVGAVETRQIGTEIRLATEIVALAKVVGQVRDLLETRLDFRDKLEDHEKRIVILETRHS